MMQLNSNNCAIVFPSIKLKPLDQMPRLDVLLTGTRPIPARRHYANDTSDT